METEKHPFQPFLPAGATLLMLGSFPPQRKRWAMDFYYPNLTNDMWRIFGLVFFGDKDHFVDTEHKTFRQHDIEQFLRLKGIAIFDTAVEVRRLQDNASDKFLEVVRPTDIPALLKLLPQCRAIVTTGEKATATLSGTLSAPQPATGHSTEFQWDGRTMRLYRMPSSSRAYPLALEKKAAAYASMFRELGLV